MQNKHSPFVNRELSKEIIAKTRLQNKLLKEKSDFIKKAFNKQQNYCVAFLKITKKRYYDKLTIELK